MARRIPHLRCKVCGSPHGKSICPVRDLNAIKELAATELISLGLTPQLEMQIRALRRSWKEKGRPVTEIYEDLPICTELDAIDAARAAEQLRQAWGARP